MSTEALLTGHRRPPSRGAATLGVVKWSYLGIAVVLAIVPFVWMVSGSFRTEADLFGNPVIVPAIAYANILVPGQVLAMHTDVGEFRGANRKVVPQWLIVVMHHSGLFEDHRMPIATMISYFGTNEGGALRYLPDGQGWKIDRLAP